ADLTVQISEMIVLSLPYFYSIFSTSTSKFVFFFSSRRRHTRSVSAFLLNRSSDLEQICRHRLRRQNVGYSNFSQPQSHLSFCVLLQYLVERRRVVTQLGKLD